MKYPPENVKYKAGDEVYANMNPSQGLVIRRYVDRIYYCTIKEKPNAKELVYFEREISPVSSSKNHKQ